MPLSSKRRKKHWLDLCEVKARLDELSSLTGDCEGALSLFKRTKILEAKWAACDVALTQACIQRALYFVCRGLRQLEDGQQIEKPATQ